MAISRWSPVSDLVSLHSAMDRLFTDSLTTSGRRRGDIFGVTGEGFLPLDIHQTEKEWVIRAGVPNVNPEQVEVTCDGDTIRIAGEIEPPENVKSEDYVMRENYYGAFSREISLPEEVMCEQATAEFQNGMLVLTMPKAEPSKRQVQKIPVKAGEAGGSQQRLEPASGTREQQPSTTGGQSSSQQREPQGAGRK